MGRKFQALALLLGVLVVWVTAPATAQRVPDWMVGKFESTGRITGRDIILSLVMTNNGEVTVSNRNSVRNREQIDASFQQDILTIDDVDYTVVRTTEGFRAIPSDDTPSDIAAVINFRRVDRNLDVEPGANRVPGFMLGRFETIRPRNGETLLLGFSRRGEITVGSRDSTRTTPGTTATYRNSMLYIDGRPYTVEETDSGFRAIANANRTAYLSGQTVPRGSVIEFRRVGNFSSDDPKYYRSTRNGTLPPSWMVGTFTGYDRSSHGTFTVRMSAQGNLHVAAEGGKEMTFDKLTVAYRRNVLTINENDYTLERTPEGFRAVPDQDENADAETRLVPINFRRTGDY